MKRVIIESPYHGTRRQMRKNYEYALACIRDSLSRGEAPLASHVLYDSILDDHKKDERVTGMSAGFAWGEVANLVAVYIDNGISPGMEVGIGRYRGRIPIEKRSLINDAVSRELINGR